MASTRLVRDGRRGPAPRQAAAAPVGVHGPGRRGRGGRDDERQRRRVLRAAVPAARGRPAGGPRAGHHGDGPGGQPARCCSPPPGCRPCTRTARWRWPGRRPPRARRWACPRSRPSRSRRSARPWTSCCSRATGWAAGRTSWPGPSGPGRPGAKGLIVTLDWVFDSRRDWGSPWIPEHLDLEAMVRHVPQVVVRPGYLARWLPQRVAARPGRAQPRRPRRARSPVSSAPTASGWARPRRPGRTWPGCGSSGAARS